MLLKSGFCNIGLFEEVASLGVGIGYWTLKVESESSWAFLFGVGIRQFGSVLLERSTAAAREEESIGEQIPSCRVTRVSCVVCYAAAISSIQVQAAQVK